MTTFHSSYQPATDDALSNWAQPEQTRVLTGAIGITMGGGNAGQYERRHESYTHTTDGKAGDAIMSTLDYRGTTKTVELEPGNPATRTNLDTAIRMGLVRVSPWGGYEQVQAQQPGTPEALKEPEEAPQADPGAGLFSESEDKAYAQLIQPLPQFAYDGALASMVAAVAHRQGTEEAAAAKLAEAAGLEPAQAGELVANAHAHYTRVVARALAPLGLAGDELQTAYSYMQDKHPARLQEAIQRLTHGRDASMFKALGLSYLADRK